MGNLGSFGQPQGNLLGQQGGMGFGLGAGLGSGMNSGLNPGFGGGMNTGLNSGFNNGLGANQGFNQGLNTGFGSGMGMGGGMNMGLGGFNTSPPAQGGQPKKLVTFDSKSNTNDDFGGFQEAKPKDPSLKNYTNAEAELIDLSGLGAAKKNQTASNNIGSINLAGW